MHTQLQLLTKIRVRLNQLEQKLIPEEQVNEHVIFELEQLRTISLYDEPTFFPLDFIRSLLETTNKVLGYPSEVFEIYYVGINDEITFTDLFLEAPVGDYFLSEAKAYKELLEQIISDEENIDSTFRKIKLNLTQHEIGILIRLFTESEFIDKGKQKYLARNFSLIFSSLEKDDLSATSLEKSAATIDLTAYSRFKDKLSAVIEGLKGKAKKTDI
jgi:hypothetical protein